MDYLAAWMFLALTILLMAGFPVTFTLLGTALTFGMIGFGWDFFNLLPLRIWGRMTNVTLAAVPLFVFMGVMLERSGLAEELLVKEVDAAGIDQVETTELDSVLPDTDVLYVTRIQKERFADPSEYDMVKDSYVITPQTMTGAKQRMALMHPLPRVGEITTDVDADPRAAYFRQMEYGMYTRMALLALVLGKA